MNHRQPTVAACTLYATAGQVDSTALNTMVTQYDDHFSYMILSNSEEYHLRAFGLAEAQQVQQWTAGHLFGPALELRWRRKTGQFSVCLLSEAITLPADLPQRQTVVVERQELLLRLWGEHTDNDLDKEGKPFWWEAQIPRLLYYPVTGQPRTVGLRVAAYRHGGQLVFTRYLALEAWQNG